MRALVLNGTDVRFEADYPNPEPQTGQSLVKITRAGVCETDLQLVKGYMGFQGVLGHEFVGIAESGPFTGQRVVGEINCNCRKCDDCNAGQGNHCTHRSVIGILNHDGAFADRVLVPDHNLLPVPDSVSDDEAVFTEPLAAAFQIPTQIDLRQNHSVIVLGDGRLGNLCAQVIAQSGCDLLVVGKHDEKLDRLRQLNIECVSLADFESRDLSSNNPRADVVVDCTGSPSGLKTALQSVRPRGTVVLKTTVAAAPDFSLASIVIDEITVVGSRCGPFDQALEALQQRSIEVTPLIADRFSIVDGVAAMNRAAEPGVMKVLLDFS